MSSYKITKASSIDQDKEYLIMQEIDVIDGEIPQTYIVDLSSQSDLTDFLRDLRGDIYDKRGDNEIFVLKGVGHKGYSKPKEELTDNEKDKDIITNIYFKQIYI